MLDIVFALGSVGPEARIALPDLYRLLEDTADGSNMVETYSRTQRIIESIIRIGGIDTIKDIREINENFSEFSISLVLAEQDDPRIVSYMVNNLSHTGSYIREVSVKYLDRHGWEPQTPSERVVYLIAKQQLDEVVTMGSQAILPLINALGYDADPLGFGDTKEIEWGSILSYLKVVQAEDMYQQLLLSVSDKNETKRLGVIKGMGLFLPEASLSKQKEAVLILIDLLKFDGSERVREKAGIALRNFSSPAIDELTIEERLLAGIELTANQLDSEVNRYVALLSNLDSSEVPFKVLGNIESAGRFLVQALSKDISNEATIKISETLLSTMRKFPQAVSGIKYNLFHDLSEEGLSSFVERIKGNDKCIWNFIIATRAEYNPREFDDKLSEKIENGEIQRQVTITVTVY